MTHPLDRPVWSALTSRQAHLAVGGARAKRLAPGYGIFAAVADESSESWAALRAINPPDGGLMLMEVGDIALPPDVPVAQRGLGVQMVADAITPGGREPEFAELGDADAAEMLALARSRGSAPIRTFAGAALARPCRGWWRTGSWRGARRLSCTPGTTTPRRSAFTRGWGSACGRR